MNTLAALPYFRMGPWQPIPGLEWLKIHSFGMFVAIGLLVCLAMATWRGEKKLGFNGERVQNYGLWLIFIGWIFAHVLNMVFYHPAYVAMNPWSLLKIWGSISSYGGLIGGIFGYWLWCWYNPEEDGEIWLDHSVWTLTFAWFFGRMGCASVHDHLGVQAPKGWALGYENAHNEVGWEFLGIVINFDKVDAQTGEFISHNWGAEGIVYHDLGLYEMLWWGVIIAVIMLLDRKPRRKGLFTAVVPLLYAPCRFLLDFLRNYPVPDTFTHPATPANIEEHLYDIPAHTEFFMKTLGVDWNTTIVGGLHADTRYLGLTPAQYLSIGLLALGIYWLFRIRGRDPIEWESYDREADDREFIPFEVKLRERLATRETKRKLGLMLMIGGGVLLAVSAYLLVDVLGSQEMARTIVLRVREGFELPNAPYSTLRTNAIIGIVLALGALGLGVHQWKAREDAPSEEAE